MDLPSGMIYPFGHNGECEVSGGVLHLEPVPRPVWNAEAVWHIIGGLVVTGHCSRGRPSEVVVQHLSQRTVVKSDIRKSLVKAGNRAAIHFVVLPIAAVHLDDGGLVTIGTGIVGGATECLGPVGGESLDVLGVEAVAERMADHVVGHHPTMPGGGKTSQAVGATRRLEDSLHTSIMTMVASHCKTMAVASSAARSDGNPANGSLGKGAGILENLCVGSRGVHRT